MNHKSFCYGVLGLIWAASWGAAAGADAPSKGKAGEPVAAPKKTPAQAERAPVCRQLSSGVVQDRSPCWSPDGKQIAFQRDWQVWVMDADGSGQRQLTKGKHRSGSPVWSPDGKLIAFHSDRRSGVPVEAGGNWDLWLMDRNGELAKLIAGDKGNEEFPYWSPDGSRISFHYRRMGPGHEFYVIGLDGAQVAHPTIGERDDVFAAWSPDGKQFALTSAESGQLGAHANLFLMDTEGKDRVSLTEGAFVDFRPCWSPDGKRVAFWAHADHGESITYTVDVASGKAASSHATTGQMPKYFAAHSPSWTADGTALIGPLAYSRNAAKEVGLTVWSGAGQVKRQIPLPIKLDAFGSTDNALGGIGNVAWSPDKKAIAATAYVSGQTKLCLVDSLGKRGKVAAGKLLGPGMWLDAKRYWFLKESGTNPLDAQVAPHISDPYGTVLPAKESFPVVPVGQHVLSGDRRWLAMCGPEFGDKGLWVVNLDRLQPE